jgi:hypothetical protein
MPHCADFSPPKSYLSRANAGTKVRAHSSIMTSQPGVTCTTTSSNAIPLTGTGAAGLTIGLLLTLVKKERGTMRLIGIVLNALSLGFTLAYGFRDCDKPSSFNNSSGGLSTSTSFSILPQ